MVSAATAADAEAPFEVAVGPALGSVCTAPGRLAESPAKPDWLCADAAPARAVQTDTNAGPAATSNGASASAAVATDTTGYNVGTPQTDPNAGAQVVTNGPVPDTRANRARFGTPDSNAGKHTSAAGN